MILRVIFKTPDAVDYVIDELPEEQVDEAKEVTEKFVKYGE